MVPVKNIFFPITLLFVFTTLMAQPPKKGTVKESTQQKFKPPIVKTSLGDHSDSVVLINVEEGLQLVKLPLIITDDKKNNYGISSYQFLYRKVGVTEDEETGKVSPISSMISDFFRSTPLPDIWVTNISQQLRAGEELYFFDVIAKDAQGHLFFAPTLKIKIKK